MEGALQRLCCTSCGRLSNSWRNARKMPDGKTRHFYGKSEADCEAKYRAALEQTAGQKESPAGTE